VQDLLIQPDLGRRLTLFGGTLQDFFNVSHSLTNASIGFFFDTLAPSSGAPCFEYQTEKSWILLHISLLKTAPSNSSSVDLAAERASFAG
jgi:hypothetical protein